MIAETGGVIGIFFAKKFISGKEAADTETVKRHIDHIIGIAGEEAVAIGSDFGGILSGCPEGLCRVYDLPLLIKTLPEKFQDKIACKNAVRIVHAHLS